MNVKVFQVVFGLCCFACIGSVASAQDVAKPTKAIPVVQGYNPICLAISQDGKTLASGASDNRIRLFDLGTGKAGPVFNHTERVPSVAFAADGKQLAAGSRNGNVRVWDIGIEKERFSIQAHKYSVHFVGFSSDANTLITASETVKFWNAKTGAELGGLLDYKKGCYAALTWDHKTLVVAAQVDEIDRSWEIAAIDVATRKVTSRRPGPKGQMSAIAVAKDSGLIALTSHVERKLFLGNLGRGQEWTTLERSRGSYLVKISQDDRLAVTAGGRDQTTFNYLILWDLVDRKPIRHLEMPSDTVYAAAFTPDGKTLITGGGSGGSLLVWDVPAIRTRPRD